ncbi:MAG: site-specific integrase [Candidatus Melainabacteria bacterium]|nr:site-specific integrase [Candidatus Melainabacteria bacterium]
MGIFQDKETGHWAIRLKYYGRDMKKVIGPDRRKAELALAEIRQEIKLAKLAGQHWQGFEKLQRVQKPKTFAEAARDFLAERVGYKSSTIASWNSIFRSYLLAEFGRTPLSVITESHLRKFQARLQMTTVRGSNKPLTESRINTIMQPLRSVLAQAYRNGELPRDPSLAVKRLEEPRAGIDPLSEEELQLALSYIDSHYQPLFTVLAYSGARPNELLALRWSDIDWNSKSISITKGRVRGHEGRPKTRSSERTIPLLPPAEQALNELKGRGVRSLDGYVFTKPNGNPIDKHLDRIWERALRKAGLRHRPSYQLRHTFATQCIVKSFPLPFIAKVLGHSTIDTLIRHYAGWIDSATKEQEKRLMESFAEIPAKMTTPKIALSNKKGEGKVEGRRKTKVSPVRKSLTRLEF